MAFEATDPLIDPYQRAITYLRVSVTDRCDFRCVYCMSEDMAFLPKADVLTLEELDRLCGAFVQRGVRGSEAHSAFMEMGGRDVASSEGSRATVRVPYVEFHPLTRSCDPLLAAMPTRLKSRSPLSI